MSPYALCKIQKFERNGKLGIFQGRGWKKILSSRIENVAIAVIQASNHFLHGSMNASDVSSVPNLPYSTAQKVLWLIY